MAVPDWLPGVERHPGEGSGSMLATSAWKLLLHTTEGPTLAGALGALDAKRAWSHFVFDPDTEHLVQCVPMNQAARALKSGGSAGRTNAARVIQVEVVGFAHDTPTWSSVRNAAVGRMIARLAAVVPFQVTMPLNFYSDTAGFTVASATAKQRLSWADWYSFNGICGHQHAPANDHWDPGGINAAQILAAAGGTNEGDLSMADAKDILDAIAALTERVVDVENHVKTIDTRTDRMNHAIGGATDPKTGKFSGSTTILGALSKSKA